MAESFTLLHPEGRADVSASFEGPLEGSLEGPLEGSLEGPLEGETVRIPAGCIRDALGWELKPEGLCLPPERGGLCVSVSDRAALADERGIDLAAFAEALGLPLALDAAAHAAALGVSCADRAASLDSLDAPEFSLPDVSGAMHSLSDYRGKKVLLIAYASW